MVLEPLPVARTIQPTRDDTEEVVAEPHDRQVGLEAAVSVENRRVDDASDCDVHFGNRHTLEVLERSCANVREVRVILADSLNVVDLLEADTVIFTRDALTRAQEVYA